MKPSTLGRKAIITGISGQDGAYLAQLLLEKGYRVLGTRRCDAESKAWRLASLGILERVELLAVDIRDSSQIQRLLQHFQPDEFYHLAGQSSVSESFRDPLSTRWDGAATLQLLEGLRQVSPATRFFNASSAEMFGVSTQGRLTEHCAFAPVSPYGCAKVFGHQTTAVYRNAFGLFACSGILFNHESPLRGEHFVTRKIARGIAHRCGGEHKLAPLELGNLEAVRDWGYAPEYTEAMWKMLQLDSPGDLVLCTGSCFSVRDFVNFCAEACEIPLVWESRDGCDLALHSCTGTVYVVSNPQLRRPTDIPRLCGDPAFAELRMGWKARTHLPGLARLMVRAELRPQVSGHH